MQCVDLGGRRIIKKKKKKKFFFFFFFYFFFFFFKQKTAYEISACLVGSEMCIRDRRIHVHTQCTHMHAHTQLHGPVQLSLIHI